MNSVCTTRLGSIFPFISGCFYYYYYYYQISSNTCLGGEGGLMVYWSLVPWRWCRGVTRSILRPENSANLLTFFVYKTVFWCADLGVPGQTGPRFDFQSTEDTFDVYVATVLSQHRTSNDVFRGKHAPCWATEHGRGGRTWSTRSWEMHLLST